MDTVHEVYAPSPFWRELASKQVVQLREGGFENFKRTINTRYFNWRILGIVRHQLFSVAARWLPARSTKIFSAEFPSPRAKIADRAASFDPISAFVYRTFVAMYTDILMEEDPRRLFDSIEEPELGNPFAIKYRGRRTSQDLCNSIHEFYSFIDPETSPDATLDIAELGAGYGRLGFVLQKALPNTTYTVIDIPPALYISERYLSELFPTRKVFGFRAFSSFDEVKDEFLSAQIRFLAPHQIELLPADSFDYFLNISSLHEMTADQVDNYFKCIDHVCRGRFYTKQWRVSRTQENEVTFTEHSYPVKPAWKVLYHEKHPIQSMFFHALYQIDSIASEEEKFKK